MLVEVTYALQRLRHGLHSYGLHPAIGYTGGAKLHVANDVTVRVGATGGVLAFTWTIKPGLSVAAQDAATTVPVSDVDEAARLIAEALGRASLPEDAWKS
ncbi:hypothetical protein GCM10022252_55810 [Streptosporangium oxazolinicum]|uniref:Uncharacterized protein n=1 Tax=Streptosporangium oxazolinicum TaxID=909287 RepID=A0ABP8BA10_9ACTN